ncbi:MAG: hypothetical protein Q9180_004601 [Flavoplaca navasiana]
MSTIIIDQKGDLLLEIIEWDHKQKWSDEKPIVQAAQTFRVSRQVLKDSSRVFTNMLAGEFKEVHQTRIKIQDWTIAYMKIWLQTLHNVQQDYNVPIEALWHLAKMADFYVFDFLKLKDWFAAWYQRQPIDTWYKQYHTAELPNPRWLLYPCWAFDHPQGFMKATSFCAYAYSHHVSEVNPTKFHDLHLPARVIQQLNAAKGRLRTVLHRNLYGPNDRLLKATCTCKEKTLWGYEKALTNCGAWPLERVAQSDSMREILSCLDGFSYELPPDACAGCTALDYEQVVEGAGTKVTSYFGGLCLDCMDRSMSNDEDADYWQHSYLKEYQYVTGCRVGKHIQSSWYFSYMGRQQRKDKIYRELHRAQRMSRFDSDTE